jgi:leader peptidase (prepilin peptidase)/N-methyltransferase
MANDVFVLYILLSMAVGFYLPRLAWFCLSKRLKQLGSPEKIPARVKRNRQVLTMILAGLATSISYIHIFSRWELWIALFFIWFLLLVSWTDLLSGLILDWFTYPAIVLFAFFRFLADDSIFLVHLWTAIFIGSASFLISWLSKGMGYGDVKLLIAGSVVVGWPAGLLAIWIATWSALLYVIYRRIKGQPFARQGILYFGPHLSVGFFFAYIWEEQILATYFSWFAIVLSLEMF